EATASKLNRGNTLRSISRDLTPVVRLSGAQDARYSPAASSGRGIEPSSIEGSTESWSDFRLVHVTATGSCSLVTMHGHVVWAEQVLRMMARIGNNFKCFITFVLVYNIHL